MGEGVDRACCALSCERDGVDMPPVVGLGAMGGAAVAEEPRRIGIGAVPEVLDPADAGRGEAGGDIAGKIEQGVLRPRRGAEEPFVRAVLGLEAGNEFGPDLIVGLADGRPERDHNARALGSAALHGGDRRFEDAGGGPAPAGMGDGDDAGGFVGEQPGAPGGGGGGRGGGGGGGGPRAGGTGPVGGGAAGGPAGAAGSPPGGGRGLGGGWAGGPAPRGAPPPCARVSPLPGGAGGGSLPRR